jgi:hypothetical protein
MAITGSASAAVAASSGSVFRALTDIAQLPSWNAPMTGVVDRPAVLEPGTDWMDELHVLGRTWPTRSTRDEFDATARRLAYGSAIRHVPGAMHVELGALADTPSRGSR